MLLEGRTSACVPIMPIPENSLVRHSESHWTSTESLVSFVLCTDHRVDVDAVSRMLLLDVATVHTSKEVMGSLKSDFDQVHLVFVPPSMTAYAEPLDRRLMTVLKSVMVRE